MDNRGTGSQPGHARELRIDLPSAQSGKGRWSPGPSNIEAFTLIKSEQWFRAPVRIPRDFRPCFL